MPNPWVSTRSWRRPERPDTIFLDCDRRWKRWQRPEASARSRLARNAADLIISASLHGLDRHVQAMSQRVRRLLFIEIEIKWRGGKIPVHVHGWQGLHRFGTVPIAIRRVKVEVCRIRRKIQRRKIWQLFIHSVFRDIDEG